MSTRGGVEVHGAGLRIVRICLVTSFVASSIAALAQGQGIEPDKFLAGVRPSVVRVIAECPGYTLCGSGTVVSPAGYILTAGHMVADATSVTVIADKAAYTASVVAIHASTDLALIRIAAGGLRPSEFGRSTSLRDGDEVWVLGYPDCQGELAVVPGKVGRTAANRPLGMVWYDAPIELGLSGGPVVNFLGELVAVHFERPVAEGGGRGVSAEVAAAFIPFEVPFLIDLNRAPIMVRWVQVSEPVEPGDILQRDPVQEGSYRRAFDPSSPVSGVAVDWEERGAEGTALLAFSGVVPVKVSNEGGLICPGDLLVVSPVSGCAMRWNPGHDAVTSFVGKALVPLEEKASGVIEVLLMAQSGW